MKEPYLQHYQTLGVQPGCAWRELKNAYRRQVKTWHPDHFEEHRHDKFVAEERIKEINKAFRALSDFHRQNGRLPLSGDDLTTDNGPAATSYTGSGLGAETWAAPAKQPRFLNPLRVMLIGVVLGLVYVWIAPRKEQGYQEASEENHAQAPAVDVSPGPSIQPRQTAGDGYFTVGSTSEEVYALQGIPSRIEARVWYYGDSRVYFVNGMVSSWHHDPRNPLKARLMADTHPASFGIGSTKAEVRAIQGAPLNENENVWDYGLSKVFFEDAKVSGWQDSLMQPLKIQK